MRHERSNVPEYMLSGSRDDFTGVGDAQHMLFCSDQARSDSEAVLSVGFLCYILLKDRIEIVLMEQQK